jgi:hypothetical protein
MVRGSLRTLLFAPSLRVAIGPVVADDVYCC